MIEHGTINKMYDSEFWYTALNPLYSSIPVRSGAILCFPVFVSLEISTKFEIETRP